MQSDLGKVFVGGISRDTDGECLKEYFSGYGEILEAITMKDRSTGRARGFGFVVFADPTVAQRVLQEKHIIDGRMVEAKKAVPRDDQSTGSRSSSSIQGSPSPSPGPTRKIFVGGIASTVTEDDFKTYFDQFGTITDLAVMYDHNTRRPRGFGFITYDSEDAVDKVLVKTFHELNGKLVEVKRAVPKELSPGPTQSPLGGYSYWLARNNFLNGYSQGYSPSTLGRYGLRMDSRFSPITASRSGFAPFSTGYGMGLPRLNPTFGVATSFNSTLSYAPGLDPYLISNSNRSTIPVGNGRNTSFFSSGAWNLLENGGINYRTSPSTPSSPYGVSGSGTIGGNFSNHWVSWGSSPVSPEGGGNAASHGKSIGHGGGENNYGLSVGGYGRNTQTNGACSPFEVEGLFKQEGSSSNTYFSS